MESLVMRRPIAVALLLTGLSLPALAQDPNAMGGGQRRFQPPPDHWMTIDSLVQAVGLTADQKPKVAQPYTALNGVMHDAAARRQAIRQQMQGSFTPGQEPTPEIRAKMASAPAELDGLQPEADQWLAADRELLSPGQQRKVD